MPRKVMRDLVICVPGITGSVLRRDGRDVWNVSGGALMNALRTLGRSIDDLKLEGDPPDVDDLGDGITAPAMIRDVHLIPGIWKIDGYTRMLRYIEETFDVTPGRNLFEFPYDWRRDNRVAARRLQQQADAWLTSWRDSSGAADAKLVLVGHSMGGLISRYFLECLDGWRDTRTLVTFGTPYRGSLNALGTLSNGMKIGFLDLTDVARSFTAIYQLLPTYPCYVDGSANPRTSTKPTSPAWIGRRRRRRSTSTARSPLLSTTIARIPRTQTAATTSPESSGSSSRRSSRPCATATASSSCERSRVRTPAGTARCLARRRRRSSTRTTMGRPSRPNNTRRCRTTTTCCSSSRAFSQGIRSTGRSSATRSQWWTSRLTSTISTRSPTRSASRCVPTGRRPAELIAIAADAETGEERARQRLAPGEDGWHEAELGPLPEGVYRVTAVGEGPVEPVTDLVAVLAE